MTLSYGARQSPLYTGNGASTNFDFNFRAFPTATTTGIAVFSVGASGALTEISTATYTVQYFAEAGRVIFNAPPANGTQFYIFGKTSVDQQLDITNYDNFYPDALEKALDRGTAIMQEAYTLVQNKENALLAADVIFRDALQSFEQQLSNIATEATIATTVLKADQALSSASSAVSTANTANTNASTALSTANAISGTASTALSTANAASAAASTATNVANSAQSAASAASGSAATANTNATKALQERLRQTYFSYPWVNNTAEQALASGLFAASLRRITIDLVGVSTVGTSPLVIQLGRSGAYLTTGYVALCTAFSGTGAQTTSSTLGFNLTGAVAATTVISGRIVLTQDNAGGNTNRWTLAAQLIDTSTGTTQIVATGIVTLGAVIDRLRLTTAGGGAGNNFDSGTMTITFEYQDVSAT